MIVKYDPIDPQLFKINRSRFVAEMKANALAIFHSSDMMPRNGDQFFPFKQNSDLFGLTGLDQEESVLLLFPDCIKEDFREVLFIKKTNPHIAVWEGHKYTKEEATQVSGVKKVLFLDEIEAVYNELILLAETIYLNSNENDRYHSDVPDRNHRMGAALRSKYPNHKYERSQPILKRLVVIKNDYEIGLLKKAISITNLAFRRVCAFTKPGVTEYEVEAEIIHEFIRNKATGHAYNPIIASGKNACVLHYNENNKPCKEGEVMLMDFGAEYANYAADLSRTIPISGRFSDRQRNVYESVLSVLKSARAMLVPGLNLQEYEKEVGKLMEAELLKLNLITKHDIEKQDPKWPAYKKYFMHGTSHHLGRDVHDLAHRYAPVEEGMVFTVEPGIYIPEEKLGIRLENDVLVTSGSPIDLMADIPIEADEIEALMNGS